MEINKSGNHKLSLSKHQSPDTWFIDIIFNGALGNIIAWDKLIGLLGLPRNNAQIFTRPSCIQNVIWNVCIRCIYNQKSVISFQSMECYDGPMINK